MDITYYLTFQQEKQNQINYSLFPQYDSIEIRNIEQTKTKINNNFKYRLFKTNFKQDEKLYLMFTPNNDFDNSIEADGGLYISVWKSNNNFELVEILLKDDHNQINRINHIYSINIPNNDFYLAIGAINTPDTSRPTQDRVDMLVSTSINFENAKSFSIRGDLD